MVFEVVTVTATMSYITNKEYIHMTKPQFKQLKTYLSTIDFSTPHTWHELYVFWLDDETHAHFGIKKFSMYCKALGVFSTTKRFDGKPTKTLIYDRRKDLEALKMLAITDTCPTCHGRGEIIVSELTDTTVVK